VLIIKKMTSSCRNRRLYTGSHGRKYCKRRSKSGNWYRVYVGKSGRRKSRSRSYKTRSSVVRGWRSSPARMNSPVIRKRSAGMKTRSSVVSGWRSSPARMSSPVMRKRSVGMKTRSSVVRGWRSSPARMSSPVMRKTNAGMSRGVKSSPFVKTTNNYNAPTIPSPVRNTQATYPDDQHEIYSSPIINKKENKKNVHFFDEPKFVNKKHVHFFDEPKEINTNFVNKKDLLNNFKVEYISGDGNCLFNSIAYFLNKNSTEVRSEVVNHITYEPPLLEFRNKKGELTKANDLKEYKDNMNEDGIWGGDFEIQIAAELYNCPIIVYSCCYTVLPDKKYGYNPTNLDNTEHNLLIRTIFNPESQGKPIHLLHVNGNHFNVLIPNS
jgi:hypothetical protein